jgi:hypothetical protein
LHVRGVFNFSRDTPGRNVFGGRQFEFLVETDQFALNTSLKVSLGRPLWGAKMFEEEAEKALLVRVLASNLITPAGKSLVKKSFAALPKSLYFSIH